MSAVPWLNTTDASWIWMQPGCGCIELLVPIPLANMPAWQEWAPNSNNPLVIAYSAILVHVVCWLHMAYVQICYGKKKFQNKGETAIWSGIWLWMEFTESHLEFLQIYLALPTGSEDRLSRSFKNLLAPFFLVGIGPTEVGKDGRKLSQDI